MITLRNVRAGYGERVALRRLCCALKDGRTTAVLGPGGSGKSTLLRVLAGSAGGRAAEPWCAGQIRGVGAPVSYLAQRPDPDDATTLRALLGAADERVLADFGDDAAATLRGRLDAPLGRLPPSERRLARLAAALARPAALVLLDEPDAGTAPRDRAWIRAGLAALRGRRTAVIVTHDLELARAVSDDALFLLDGRLVEANETTAFFTAPSRRRTRDLITDGG